MREKHQHIHGENNDKEGKAVYSIGLALLFLVAGKASAELVCYQLSTSFTGTGPSPEDKEA